MESDQSHVPSQNDVDDIASFAKACEWAFGDIGILCSQDEVKERQPNLFGQRENDRPIFTPSDLKDEYEQFVLWTKNLGVFAADQASLDYRLREADAVKLVILGLLRRLLSNLSKCVLLLQGRSEAAPLREDPDSSSQSSGSDFDLENREEISEAFEIQARIEDIAELVNKLLKLASSIRVSGVRSRTLRASAYEHWEGETNQTEAFEKNFLPLVLERRYSLQGFLLERICKAVSLRRRRFLYQMTHQRRLAYGDRKHDPVMQDFQVNELSTEVTALNSSSSSCILIDDVGIMKRKFEMGSELHPYTRATTLDQEALKRRKGSMISGSSRASASYAVEIPPPPPLPSERATHFQCPYCCILVGEDKQSAKKWKKHVVADLQPFVCLDSACPTPDIIFDTMEDWIEHQIWQHSMEWWCDGDEGSHDPQSFSDQREFECHLRADHHILSPNDVSSLVKASGRPSIFPFNCCPFCSYLPEDMERLMKGQNEIIAGEMTFRAKKSQAILQSHIANELLRYFVLALPDRDDITENGPAISLSQNIRSSRTDPGSVALDSDEGSTDPGDENAENEDFPSMNAIDSNQWEVVRAVLEERGTGRNYGSLETDNFLQPFLDRFHDCHEGSTHAENMHDNQTVFEMGAAANANAIKVLEYERWALEIDQFRTLKLDDNNAEKLYEKLKDKSKEFEEEPNQKAKLLGLRIAYVDMLIEQKDYLRAEEVAKTTWEEYKHEDADDSRFSYRQLCKVLHQQGPEKYLDLEELLRETWPARNKKHQSQPLWTLENGDELCSVLELKGDFESAYALRKRLWRERREEQGKRHKDTVRTGIWASQCKIKQRAALEKQWSPAKKDVAYENAMEIAKEIWELWDPHQPSEADVGILTGGHLLGYLHYCQRAYEDARRVLEVVWKERKALLIQSPEDTMLTGHYLSQTYFQLGDRSEANSVFEEVWNAMKFAPRETCEDRVLKAYHLSIDCLENAITAGSENQSVPEAGKGHLLLETLKAWFEIGWAVLNQEKYQDAVCILQQVYNAYRAVPGVELHYEDIFTCGRYLGEAIAKQGKGCAQATTILEKILEEQTQHGTKNEFEVLECRHLYGCLLKELAESQTTSPNELLQKAVEELKSVWQARYNTNSPGLDRPRMLEAGYCLTSALIGLLKISEAHRVLEEVWELEEKGPEKNAVESLAFCHSLGVSLMDLGKDKRVTKEVEITAEIFQRVWDTRKGPTRYTGILKDGYYLGCCRMKLQQYLEAKDVLEEVEQMIAEAEFRDRGSLMEAVKGVLAECKGLVENQRERRRGDRMRRGASSAKEDISNDCWNTP